MWYAMCPDTLAPSHSRLAVREAGAVTADAEYKKLQKYMHACASQPHIGDVGVGDPYLCKGSHLSSTSYDTQGGSQDFEGGFPPTLRLNIFSIEKCAHNQ